MGFPGLEGWQSCKWCRQPALVSFGAVEYLSSTTWWWRVCRASLVLLDPVKPVAIKRSCRPFTVEAITTEPFGQTTERCDWPGLRATPASGLARNPAIYSCHLLRASAAAIRARLSTPTLFHLRRIHSRTSAQRPRCCKPFAAP